MASARLPGGVNRTGTVRGALLALGPDEWLRTDCVAALLGSDVTAANEILCRLRSASGGAIESRVSTARNHTGKRYFEWRIRAGRRADVDVASTHGRPPGAGPYAGPPRGRYARPGPVFVVSTEMLAALARWSVTPGLANTR